MNILQLFEKFVLTFIVDYLELNCPLFDRFLIILFEVHTRTKIKMFVALKKNSKLLVCKLEFLMVEMESDVRSNNCVVHTLGLYM